MPFKQSRHLGRGLQELIREALAPEAGAVDRAPLADAGHDILEHPPLGRVIEHVVRRDGRHARGPVDTPEHEVEPANAKRLCGEVTAEIATEPRDDAGKSFAAADRLCKGELPSNDLRAA